MPEPRCEFVFYPSGQRCQKPPHERGDHWWNSVDDYVRLVPVREALRNVIAYAEARLPSDDPGWQSIRAIAREALGDDAGETTEP